MAINDPQINGDETQSTAGPSSSAAVFKRLHPSHYLSQFLAQGYRPDGRKSSAWRDVNVNVGTSARSIL